MADINVQLGIPVYKNGAYTTTPSKLGIGCQGPQQDSAPQPGFPPASWCLRQSVIGDPWEKNGTHGASLGPRSRDKEPLEQAVVPDQDLMGLLKQGGPQEPMGLLETMGPLELDRASGQEPMGPPEQVGALGQEPMELLWRPWGP